MKSLLRLITLTSALLCTTAYAQFENFYIEGLAGQSSFDLDTKPFTNNAFVNTTPATGVPANTITVTSTDKSAIAYGLRAGYDLLPWLAMELTYTDAGTARVKGVGVLNTPTASASAVSFSVGLHVQNWTIAFAPHWDFNDKFSVIGRVGVLASTAGWEKTIVAQSNPVTATSAATILRDALRRDERSTELYYGVGLNWKVIDRVSVGLNYDVHNAQQGAKIISGSVRFSF